jgi:hypothetical protein
MNAVKEYNGAHVTISKRSFFLNSSVAKKIFLEGAGHLEEWTFRRMENW